LKLSFQKIYPITDRELSGLSITEQVTQFIEGGAKLIQIRDKQTRSDELFHEVKAAVKIAHQANALIIVNDRVDIAMTTGADGVHLGQDDMPVITARQILGDDAIIGVSTHNEEQMLAAFRESNADYIAFGPIFSTVTKIDHDPPVGIEALAKMRTLIGRHQLLVAIGGINATNLASVIEAGADSAAMIGAFYSPGVAISSKFRSLLELANGNNNVVTS